MALFYNRHIYIEFIELNKQKKNIVQVYIQKLMAAHVSVNNGYLTIE